MRRNFNNFAIGKTRTRFWNRGETYTTILPFCENGGVAPILVSGFRPMLTVALLAIAQPHWYCPPALQDGP